MIMSHAVLPRPGGAVFLTDGGLETSLIFHDGVDLPLFAAFPLLLNAYGRQQLTDYFAPFVETALARHAGFIIDTPTWRANRDWGEKLGFDADALAEINREAVAWAKSLRRELGQGSDRIVVNGVGGPRGDGYRPTALMDRDGAEHYHHAQIEAFHAAGADMVSGMTINYVDEACGIARAAAAYGLPCVISFTVETDGNLASGASLRAAIETVDDDTDGAPIYYMINCAHPTHFATSLGNDEAWMQRLGGVRANASAKSHAELDEASELDPGDPDDLGRRYGELRRQFGQISVLGGCCGTDRRHIAAICEACL